MLPEESSVTPGMSLLPRTRGPMPDRNNNSPTRFAWGNAPTGSGARSLLKVSFMAYLLPSISMKAMQILNQLKAELTDSDLFVARPLYRTDGSFLPAAGRP